MSGGRKIKRWLVVLGICGLVAGSLAVASAAVSGSMPYLSLELVVSAFDTEQYNPVAAYNPDLGEYLVVWENGDGDGIYAQRVTEQGQRIGPVPIPISAGLTRRINPAVAYNPNDHFYLVVWAQETADAVPHWEIAGRFVPAAGADPAWPEFIIQASPGDQETPRLAYARQQGDFLVIWAHSSSEQYAIRGRRVVTDTSKLGPVFTVITNTANAYYPELAYNASRNEYLVAYALQAGVETDIYAQRLSGDGSAVGSGEFVLGSNAVPDRRPALAACWQADQYLVAWERHNLLMDHGIFGRLVAGDGSLPGDELTLQDTPDMESLPTLACGWGGLNYLLAWQEQLADPGSRFGIQARQVRADATLENSFDIVLPGDHADRTTPAVVGGNTNYLVTWEHVRVPTSYLDIHARVFYPYVTFLPLVIH